MGPPDIHRLTAALGWLELGNAREGLAELEEISPSNQPHPDVLQVRWAVLAELKDWAAAALAAERLVKVAPDNVSGWLHRAYARRRAPGGGLEAAKAALLPAAEMFPEEQLVLFNLACYACQMGDLDGARAWLDRACKAGDAARVREQALADPDLEPLWQEIRARPTT